MQEGFLLIIKAFAKQIDFNNYDLEVAHASMRTCLGVAIGKSLRSSAACVMHMGQDLGRNHVHGAPASTLHKAKGRPTQDYKNIFDLSLGMQRCRCTRHA